ncbi:MAG: glycosyltransferase family 2 protein [Planctomycetaceae bacterium]|nr:glycosyltransferase family 2 protein [Planctomycetaceae bacterium]
MDTTIAICTWNRSDLLDKTLAHMRHLEIPVGTSWEIVVVNNRCTDNTDEIIAAHARSLPVRRVFEEKQGQSHARNAAAMAARGELIIWTDDDVLVDSKWLVEMLAAARARPEFSFFGGPIEPWFEHDPPQWLLDNWPAINGAFAFRDLGNDEFEFDLKRLPYGANYAMRTSVQRAFPYNPKLGRVATGEIRGEETDVLHKLLAAGHRGWWVPASKVKHFIPAERLTLDYIRRFFHGIGQTEFIRKRGESSQANIAMWERPRTLVNALQAEVRYRYYSTFRPKKTKRWVNSLVRSSRLWGHLAACNAAMKKAA